MPPEKPKDDWDRLIEERDNPPEEPWTEDPKEPWIRFFSMLCLFIFLTAVLDLSPLFNFIFRPLETLCQSTLK